MQLNDDNYYSQEANQEYWSVSTFKNFCKCESRALAMLKGEYVPEKSDALLMGSYVDASFEGTLETFKTDHPELFTKKGELYSQYKLADKMIAKASSNRKFMAYMSGEKQKIVSGEIFGHKWKGKLDSYIQGKAIVDLKTVSKIVDITKWNYPLQAAVYQELIMQETGLRLPFYLACVSKENVPELAIIQIPQMFIDDAMNQIAENIDRFAKIKSGEINPERCCICDYCKETKVLSVTNYADYI